MFSAWELGRISSQDPAVAQLLDCLVVWLFGNTIARLPDCLIEIVGHTAVR